MTLDHVDSDSYTVFSSCHAARFCRTSAVFAYTHQTKVNVVSSSLDPIPTDSGFSVCAATTFKDCPNADLLVFPVAGVFEALQDKQLLDFIRRQARVAKYVTSVCTGMFLLGAIGVLRGKRVTSHWGYTEAIAACGASFAEGRVGVDGNIITSGGVTSGLDYAMVAIAELCVEETAKMVQLRLEYDPAPPFNSGHPSRASDQTVGSVSSLYAKATDRMKNCLLEVTKDEVLREEIDPVNIKS